MESILNSNIYNTYPAFSANQVLTDTQLNHLRDYLDQQNRLTRIRAIGCGIICGLKAWHEYTDEGQNRVNICEGYGLTSSGFLLEFKVPEVPGYASYTYYKTYEPVDVDGDELEDNEWLKDVLDAGHSVLELIDQAADQKGLGVSKQDKNQPLPLDKDTLKDKVLALLLKKAEEALDPCVLTMCNNQGNNIAYTVVPILVPKEVFESVEGEEPVTDDEDLFTTALHVSSLATGIKIGFHDLWSEVEGNSRSVYNVLFRNSSGSNTSETAFNRINRLGISYSCVVEEMREKLISRIDQGYQKFQKLLNLDLDPSEITDCLERQLNKAKDIQHTQYYYDYVRDLACAWNEFLISVQSLTQYCFSKDEYPCHLNLGAFIPNSTDAKLCDLTTDHRSIFEASPASNVLYGELENSRNLFLRIVYMITHFSEEVANYTPDSLMATITSPSQSERAPLGERAIPFYYQLGEADIRQKFEQFWQPKLKNSIDPIIHYYRWGDKTGPTYSSFPSPYESWTLTFASHKNEFWRIEGHIGKNIEVAYEEIDRFRNEFALDFQIIVSSFVDNAGSIDPEGASDEIPIMYFRSLMNSYKGVVHTGGVNCGGTFILVADDQLNVVADFSACSYIHLEFEEAGSQAEETITIESVQTAQSVSSARTSVEASSSATSRSIASSSTESSSPKLDVSKRRAQYYQAVMALNSNNEFARNRSFQSVVNYLSKNPKSVKVASEGIREIIAKTTALINRKSTPQPKRLAYQQMLEKSWQLYADTIVNKHATKFPENERAVMKEAIKDMNNAGLNIKKLSQNWKSSEISANKAGKQILEMMK